MAEEAFNMCVAAADTTGNAMTVATYHVIINPNIYERLTGELEEAFPDPDAAAGKTQLPYSALEKLPYLTAVIKEGQR